MELLFVYGTLQDPAVQARVFARVVPGTPDALDGYRKESITIDRAVYPIAVQDADSRISGQVIEVTPEELVLIDQYEGAEYRRVRVRLSSQREAWVYCE